MILSAILTLMAVAAVAALAWPLVRKTHNARPRREFERGVLADQMAEIDRDLERGVIGAAEAEAARNELGRRALARLEDTTATAAPAPPRKRPLALALMIALPLVAGLIYVTIGRPDLPGLPFAAREGAAPTRAAPSRETMMQVVGVIEGRVREAPSDPEGWRLLLRLNGHLGRTDDAAAKIYNEALAATAAPRHRAAIALAFGEAVMTTSDGNITKEAREAFTTALAADPAHPAARYYQGRMQIDSGDPRGALRTWSALRRDAPADAPWAKRLDEDIARLKREHRLDAPAK
jgi:cytochrome c-type biogenesis protein CcmH